MTSFFNHFRRDSSENMKRAFFIVVLGIYISFLPSPLKADEIKMLIWHPDIPSHDKEWTQKVESLVDYVNQRLTSDHLTYFIAGTPERAAEILDQERPAIGIVYDRYRKRHREIISPGRPWFFAPHLLEEPKSPDLFLGSEQFLPDLASHVLLKGKRSRKQEKEERFDIFSFMRPMPLKGIGTPLTMTDREIVESVINLRRSIVGIFKPSPRRARRSTDERSAVIRFSPDIPEGEVIEDTLLKMNSDPVGRKILQSLYFRGFIQASRPRALRRKRNR